MDLPPGTTVSSREEAHEEQKDFIVNEKDVEIVGFYSKEHKGIFTHHDADTHMHLISSDRKIMGHLDDVSFNAGAMNISFPIATETTSN